MSALEAVLERMPAALRVADAVLFEGYLLYPYTATTAKNQVRWTFGAISPIGAEADGAGEGPVMRTECLLRGGPDARIDVLVRYLALETRSDPRRHDRAWDEGVEESVTAEGLRLGDLIAADHRIPVARPSGASRSADDPDGVSRRREALDGLVTVSARPAVDADDLLVLRVEIENLATYAGGGREAALRRSLVSAHTLLAVTGGGFVSLMDPPEGAAAAARDCDNQRTWPVLAGADGADDVVLSSPIVLYDHPEIAPESPGDLFDSTEIDEILTLRILTMTDEEKAAARATDARAAALIDRAESLGPQDMERLHGAVRSLRSPHAGTSEEAPAWPGAPGVAGPELDLDVPTFTTPGDEGIPLPTTPWWDPGQDASVSPDTDAVRIAGVDVARGSQVVLAPSRRADAQDLFLAGRRATVAAVLHDVDGAVHVAVTLDDDPAADLADETGRYRYFSPDEIRPVDVEADA